jgi:hypothetical protein
MYGVLYEREACRATGRDSGVFEGSLTCLIGDIRYMVNTLTGALTTLMILLLPDWLGLLVLTLGSLSLLVS